MTLSSQLSAISSQEEVESRKSKVESGDAFETLWKRAPGLLLPLSTFDFFLTADS